MDTIEKINEAIDSLTEAARVNGVESPLVDFLLNHLAEFADDLAEKYDDESEEE